MEKLKAWVAVHRLWLVAVAVIFIGGVAYALGRYAGTEKVAEQPALLSQEATRDAEELRSALDVSRKEAAALEERLTAIQSGQRAPSARFYVSAPTPERAASVVERQIRTDDPALPRAARERSDRTVVTPIVFGGDGDALPPEEQRVDVYKINLRKDHRIKAGVTVADGKPLAAVGYEQGRVEALVHFGGGGCKGVTVLYNVAEW